MTQEF